MGAVYPKGCDQVKVGRVSKNFPRTSADMLAPLFYSGGHYIPRTSADMLAPLFYSGGHYIPRTSADMLAPLFYSGGHYILWVLTVCLYCRWLVGAAVKKATDILVKAAQY